MSGVDLIAKERQRQIDEEGYGADHDKHESPDYLALAGATYALPARSRTPSSVRGDSVPATWPWSEAYWKPTPDDRLRELVKAGALIAAEIDKLLAEEG